MKAVRFHQHGGPDVLRYEEAPDPVSVSGRAIVGVRACAWNHLDLRERRGLNRTKLPRPHISGSDIAGTVADSGGGVVGTGRRVMIQPASEKRMSYSCSPAAALADAADAQRRLEEKEQFGKIVLDLD